MVSARKFCCAGPPSAPLHRLVLPSRVCLGPAPCRRATLPRPTRPGIQPPLHVGDKPRDIPRPGPSPANWEPEAGPVATPLNPSTRAHSRASRGTPLNLLVTIDRRGNFLGVELLRQHEPVFLSGLGEEPLKDFRASTKARASKQEITVSSSMATPAPAPAANGWC